MSSARKRASLVVAGAAALCISGISNAFIPAGPTCLARCPPVTSRPTTSATIPVAFAGQARCWNGQWQQHVLPLHGRDDNTSSEREEWERDSYGGDQEDTMLSSERTGWQHNTYTTTLGKESKKSEVEKCTPSEGVTKSSGERVGTLPLKGDGVDGKNAEHMDDPATRSKLKVDLIRKVATLNRGFVAQEADRVDIEEIVEMLELQNPNSTPCRGFENQSSPLAGRWQLLYTTSLDMLSLQVNPTVTVGQIYQDIDSDGQCIKYMIELQPPFAAVVNRFLGGSLATLTVKFDAKPVSDTRVGLAFKRTEFQVNSLFGRELDLPALGMNVPCGDGLQNLLSKGKEGVQCAKRKAEHMIKKSSTDNATDDARVGEASEMHREDSKCSSLMKPYFETTYVDEDLRIGRTGRGDVYVSTRVLV